MSLTDNFLFQNIEEGIRGPAILVLILINIDEMIEGFEIAGTLRKSDHVMLEFNIMQTQAIEQNITTVLDFKRGDFNKLRGSLGKISWMKILKKKFKKFKNSEKNVTIKAQFSTITLKNKNKKIQEETSRTLW